METLQTTTPAKLHHLHLTSADPERLAGFYAQMLDYVPSRSEDGTYALSGGQRKLLIGKGPSGEAHFIAFTVRDVESLERLRGKLTATGPTASEGRASRCSGAPGGTDRGTTCSSW